MDQKLYSSDLHLLDCSLFIKSVNCRSLFWVYFVEPWWKSMAFPSGNDLRLCYFAAIGDVTTAQYLLDQARWFVNCVCIRSKIGKPWSHQKNTLIILYIYIYIHLGAILRKPQSSTESGLIFWPAQIDWPAMPSRLQQHPAASKDGAYIGLPGQCA